MGRDRSGREEAGVPGVLWKGTRMGMGDRSGRDQGVETERGGAKNGSKAARIIILVNCVGMFSETPTVDRWAAGGHWAAGSGLC